MYMHDIAVAVLVSTNSMAHMNLINMKIPDLWYYIIAVTSFSVMVVEAEWNYAQQYRGQESLSPWQCMDIILEDSIRHVDSKVVILYSWKYWRELVDLSLVVWYRIAICIYASKKFWRILIWWLLRQSTKLPNFPAMRYSPLHLSRFCAAMIFLDHLSLLALIRVRFMLWTHLLKKNTWSFRYMYVYAYTVMFLCSCIIIANPTISVSSRC